MGFNSAFKGLKTHTDINALSYQQGVFFPWVLVRTHACVCSRLNNITNPMERGSWESNSRSGSQDAFR